MKTALIQLETTSDPDQLRKKLTAFFEQARTADLIVLPELFNTPYVLDDIRKNSENSTKILEILQELCRKHQVWCIAGTLAIPENNRLKNRCYVIGPQGELIDSYDKIHLLQVEGNHPFREKEIFDGGDHLCVFELEGWKIGILVCYDIRFPELARAYEGDIDLLVVPAAFNEAVGRKHWKSLLQTRAMENQFFLLGVNPAAKDYGTYRSYGHSLAIDPDGKILKELDGQEALSLVELDHARIAQIRERSPYWKIRDEKLYQKLRENSYGKNTD